MGKIDNLEKYIAECDNLVNSTSKERENFIEKMVGVYGNEIKNITNGLNSFPITNPISGHSFGICSFRYWVRRSCL